MDFLTRLFDPSGFPPRWQCGTGWSETPWLGWVHVFSDIGIWAAYFAIPIVLGLFVVRKKDLPFRTIFLLFGAFILLCGLTHLIEAVIFWWPAYRLAAAVKFATAAVCWGTVLALFPIIPVALALKSPAELQREIDARRSAEERLQEANQELERRVNLRTADLQHAIADLSAERELLQTTLRSIGDGVVVTDREGQVTFLNAVGEALTGWTAADANGVPLEEVFQIVNETTRAPVDNPALRALREGAIVGLANHTLLIARDGSERPIDDSAAPIRGADGTAGAVLVFRDISERKKADLAIADSNQQLALANDALRRSESGLQLAIAIAGMGTFDIDLSSDHVLVNDQGRAIYGWLADEALTFSRVQTHFHEADKQAVLEQVATAMDPSGPGEFEVEQRIVRVDGELRWIRVRGRAIFVDDNDTLQRRAARCVGTFLDVTERKRNEDALRYQLDLTRAITDNATTAIFMSDSQGRCTFMNPAAEIMTGFSFSEVGGKILHDVIHHHHADGRPYPASACPIDRALPGQNDVRDLEEVFFRKNGDCFPVLCNARVIYKHDATVGTVVEVRDITDLKDAEGRLRASESKFRQIADAMPQIVWVTSADGQHEYFNRRWYAFTGELEVTTDHTGAGKQTSWRHRVHPEDHERAWTQWQHSLQTGESFDIQFRLQHHSGEYRWFLGRALPVRDESGEIAKWFGTCTDIEEYKRLEGDRHKFVSLVESSTDFVGFCDLYGTPLYINQAGLDLVGLNSSDEARERSIKDFIFPADRDTLSPHFERQVLTRGHGEIEIRLQNLKTGEPRWMICNVFTLVNQDGERVGLATVSRDITNRRQLEDNLRTLANDLSEADRRKDEFLATLAHELRNPLAPIRNGLQVLKLASQGNAILDQTRTMMERQLGQMVRLVDDLLDVSRITRNKLELRKESVTLAAVLRDALETSRPVIEAGNHRLVIDIPEQPIVLEADPTRLSQVIANLLNNAAKYTDDGGEIKLQAELNAAGVMVQVKDSGIGIPPSMLPKVFDMFTQVDRMRDRTQGGLGIGLTLVRRLVELHGGSIEAQSDGEGQGSEFTVQLPVLPEAITAPTAPIAIEPPRPTLLRILIADDNKDAADTLAMMLRFMKHQVETVYNGQQAVEAAARSHPDVIFLDIGMPEMNGYEAAKAIRSLAVINPMTLVALTGWGQEDDRRRSRDAGFDQHLVKPADPAVLQSLLAGVSLTLGHADR